MSESDEISSGTDDDDILNAIMPGSARKIQKSATPSVTPSAPDSDEEVRIPTIFLTQGAKNHSLLNKANAISQHIKEEQEKTQRQLEELESLRREFLEEINDNGSYLVYTSKSAHRMIETYIQNHYANHYSLRAHRHFYYFDDVYEVSVGGVSEEKGAYVEALGFSLDMSLYPTFNAALQAQGVTKEDIVLWYISNCLDEDTLVRVLAFVRQYNHDGEPKTSLAATLRKISGKDATFKATLKSVHYNNNVRLSLIRAAMLFEVYPASTDRESYILSFILACSDFHGNKRERQSLLHYFMKPTFKKIVSTSDAAASEITGILSRIETHYFGKPPDGTRQKHYELVHNFLNNLYVAFKHDDSEGAARKALNRLIRSFLEDSVVEESTPLSVDQITKLLTTHLPSSPSNGQNLALANPIYKYSYKAKLCVKLLTELMYSKIDKKAFLNLHHELQTLKDRLQQDMSHWLFLSNENPYKTDVSGALSEAYHALDQFSNVLDKNIPLIQKDIFYDDPH